MQRHEVLLEKKVSGEALEKILIRAADLHELNVTHYDEYLTEYAPEEKKSYFRTIVQFTNLFFVKAEAIIYRGHRTDWFFLYYSPSKEIDSFVCSVQAAVAIGVAEQCSCPGKDNQRR